MPKIFNNNILNFFSFIILTLISLAFLDNLPSILDTFQPDSSGYIQFNPYRKSLYPYFIKIVDFLNFDILFIQRLIFSLSIIFLFFCLVNYGLKMYLGLIFLIFIFSNLYYVSYTETILTESLFFSAMNFFTGFNGGKLSKISDYNLNFQMANYGLVEDCHVTIMHFLSQFIRSEKIKSKNFAKINF